MARAFDQTFTRDDGIDVFVRYSLTPERPPIIVGPAEDCEPGCAMEIEILKVVDDLGRVAFLTDAEKARVVAEIERDPPEYDRPDPDDLRDQARDDALDPRDLDRFMTDFRED